MWSKICSMLLMLVSPVLRVLATAAPDKALTVITKAKPVVDAIQAAAEDRKASGSVEQKVIDAVKAAAPAIDAAQAAAADEKDARDAKAKEA